MSRLVVGVGARPGTAAEDLMAAVAGALAEVNLPVADVGVLATIDRRAGEAGVLAVAASRRWKVVSLTSDELASIDVREKNERVAAAVSTGSVAEAAAIAAAGPGGVLILPKRIAGGVTVAIARTGFSLVSSGGAAGG
jgi:cobalamin biosynthesis protein CbiG